MSMSKILGLGDLIKYVLIFVVAIIFIAIFFIGYGVFFVPLIMVGAVIGFLLLTGAWQRAPLWQVMFFIFITFFAVYAIQRMCGWHCCCGSYSCEEKEEVKACRY